MGKTLVKHHCGYCCKRNGYRNLAAVCFFRVNGVVFVVKTHGYPSAFSGKRFRRNLLAVQVIGNFLGDRRFFSRCSAVINVFAVCLPDQFFAVCRKAFPTPDIFNIGQLGIILKGCRVRIINQVAADNCFMRISRCVR